MLDAQEIPSAKATQAADPDGSEAVCSPARQQRCRQYGQLPSALLKKGKSFASAFLFSGIFSILFSCGGIAK
jgi:hypothetical protein